jgi:hypothetical protein
MAWRQICRNGDPLPKLQRYETALSNRIHKAVKLLLKLRGHDQPGQLQNEANFEPSPTESVTNTVENPPPPPPESHPATVQDVPAPAAQPQNGAPVALLPPRVGFQPAKPPSDSPKSPPKPAGRRLPSAAEAQRARRGTPSNSGTRDPCVRAEAPFCAIPWTAANSTRSTAGTLLLSLAPRNRAPTG